MYYTWTIWFSISSSTIYHPVLAQDINGKVHNSLPNITRNFRASRKIIILKPAVCKWNLIAYNSKILVSGGIVLLYLKALKIPQKYGLILRVTFFPLTVTELYRPKLCKNTKTLMEKAALVFILPAQSESWYLVCQKTASQMNSNPSR